MQTGGENDFLELAGGDQPGMWGDTPVAIGATSLFVPRIEDLHRTDAGEPETQALPPWPNSRLRGVFTSGGARSRVDRH